ncbi:MAG: HNH/ENDO VII family nuclease [Clostridia bacterium]|nr:HNH/ENDO VII family nuclease [Clostridia bacterium]
MKKIIALLLVCALLTGCSAKTIEQVMETPTSMPSENATTAVVEHVVQTTEQVVVEDEIAPDFEGMDDPDLLPYLEDTIYTQVVSELDSEAYFVENVSAIYISQEYLDEVAYNSQENIYFGYTLSELDESFEGTRYVFTLDENGNTVVREFEEYDDTYNQVIKNVAIGSGVIIICVVVSYVTAGTSTAAVSAVFAASAKGGAAMALSNGVIGSATAAITTAVETDDKDAIIKAAALSGSEGFKWGAIIGTVSTGVTQAGRYTRAFRTLKGTELTGITMQQAAVIQVESGYPASVIKQFHSMDEYQVYRNAGLYAQNINGQMTLARDIDLNYESTLGGRTVTNLERMQEGYAPVDPVTGKVYQLHHVGQRSDGALAILTETEHQGNASILNIAGKASEIDRTAFTAFRRQFWKDFAAMVG